jgi:heat shock protein HtpX
MVFAGALVAEAWQYGNAPVDFLVAKALNDLIVALPVATLGTLIWIFIAWKFHQSMIDALTGGH